MKIISVQNRITLTITIAFVFLLSTCKKESNPIVPPDHRPVLTSSDYGRLVLTLFSYDAVRVTHQMGLDLRSPSVVRVEIGEKNSGAFVPSVSLQSTYDASAEAYIIHFDFTVRMDSSEINAPLTIRYIANDSTFHDVDTTVALYKYPYSSAQVLADSTTLQNSRSPIQGLSLAGSTMYYHPINDGLYAFDLVSHVSSLRWNGYYRGSHIAADSNFVFCDVTHQTISRFDLTTNTAITPMPDLGNIYSIGGMAVQDHTLYVLIYGLFTTYIATYSLDGVPIDSIPYPSTDSYFMAMSDSVVYCKDESSVEGAYRISRFDLTTRSFLTNLMSPAKVVEGIAINDGKLYYFDMRKNFVGVMPFADLKTESAP